MPKSSRYVAGPVLLMLLAGCGNEPPIDPSVTGGERSPLSLAAIASLTTAPPAGSTAYVSVPPGTVPHGATLSVVDLAGGLLGTAALVDGGADPLSVAAGDGDSLRILATDSAGTTYAAVEEVRARRPRVVRTVPAVHKTDVPLNVRIRIVFSEPVTLPSVVGGVHLYDGANAIAGTATLLEGSPTTIEFVPAADLDATTDYVLRIDETITDLDGVSLEQSQSLPFRTSAAVSGLPPRARVFVAVNTTINDTNTTFVTGAQLHIDGGPGVLLVPGVRVFDVSPMMMHTFTVTDVVGNCQLLSHAYVQLNYAAGDTVDIPVTLRCVSAGLRVNLVTEFRGGNCSPEAPYPVHAQVLLSRDGVGVQARSIGLCGNMLLGDIEAGDYVMEVYPVTSYIFEWPAAGLDGCVTLSQVVTVPAEGITDLPAHLDCREGRFWRRTPP